MWKWKAVSAVQLLTVNAYLCFRRSQKGCVVHLHRSGFCRGFLGCLAQGWALQWVPGSLVSRWFLQCVPGLPTSGLSSALGARDHVNIDGLYSGYQGHVAQAWSL